VAVVPQHVVDGGRSAKIIGVGGEQSTSKPVKMREPDIALLRIAEDNNFACEDWLPMSNLTQLLESTEIGYLKIRQFGGSSSIVRVRLGQQNNEYVSITPGTGEGPIRQSWSGAPLLVNNAPVGLLMFVQSSEGNVGMVLRLDRIMQITQPDFPSSIIELPVRSFSDVVVHEALFTWKDLMSGETPVLNPRRSILELRNASETPAELVDPVLFLGEGGKFYRFDIDEVPYLESRGAKRITTYINDFPRGENFDSAKICIWFGSEGTSIKTFYEIDFKLKYTSYELGYRSYDPTVVRKKRFKANSPNCVDPNRIETYDSDKDPVYIEQKKDEQVYAAASSFISAINDYNRAALKERATSVLAQHLSGKDRLPTGFIAYKTIVKNRQEKYAIVEFIYTDELIRMRGMDSFRGRDPDTRFDFLYNAYPVWEGYLVKKDGEWLFDVHPSSDLAKGR